MRKTIAAVLLAVLAPALAAAQEGLPELKVTGRVEPSDSKYFMLIQGTGLFPKGTMLDVELNYVKKIRLPEHIAKQMGREFDTENVCIDKGTATLNETGTFTIRLGGSARKPYSGEYLVIVLLMSDGQPPEIKKFLAKFADNLPCQYTGTIKVGSPEELAKEKAAVAGAIFEDLKVLHGLFVELEKNVKQVLAAAAFDQAAWDKWHKDWDARLNALEEANGRRLDAETHWREPAAKRYIASITEEMRTFVKEVCEPEFVKPPDKRMPAAEVTDRLSYSGIAVARAVDFLQFGKLVDADAIKRTVETGVETAKKTSEWFGEFAKGAGGHDETAWKKERTRLLESMTCTMAALVDTTAEYHFAALVEMQESYLGTLAEISEAVAKPSPEGDRNLRILKGLEDIVRELSDLGERAVKPLK
jgi:hypothetical protein